GPHFDIDFKRKAFQLSEEEFAAAYARLQGNQTAPYCLTDMTEAQLDWMTTHALGPRVLEVGCGFGVLAERLGRRGDLTVAATGLSAQNVEMVQRRLAQRLFPKGWEKGTVPLSLGGRSPFPTPSETDAHLSWPVDVQVANVEALPFADRSFDSTLCD